MAVLKKIVHPEVMVEIVGETLLIEATGPFRKWANSSRRFTAKELDEYFFRISQAYKWLGTHREEIGEILDQIVTGRD